MEIKVLCINACRFSSRKIIALLTKNLLFLILTLKMFCFVLFYFPFFPSREKLIGYSYWLDDGQKYPYLPSDVEQGEGPQTPYSETERETPFAP